MGELVLVLVAALLVGLLSITRMGEKVLMLLGGVATGAIAISGIWSRELTQEDAAPALRGPVAVVFSSILLLAAVAMILTAIFDGDTWRISWKRVFPKVFKVSERNSTSVETTPGDREAPRADGLFEKARQRGAAANDETLKGD